MASAQQPTSWQPNGERRGPNSGTKGSVNDRDCAHCGAVREHTQRTKKIPPKVYCPECFRSQNVANKDLRMSPNEEDKKEGARLRAEGLKKGRGVRRDKVKAKDAARVAENPPATQDELDAEHDALWDYIKGGRPAEGGLFWRQLCGLVCLCNCAICLLAVLYSPTVFMVFCYLWGCIPAKKNDVVAIPKEYIAWAVAVADLMDKLHPGRRDTRAFCPIRALQNKDKTKIFPVYDRSDRGFDLVYDEEKRTYQYRVSLCARTGQDLLMPGATYDPKRDWLAVFKSEGVGHGGVGVIAIPLLMMDESGRYRKTVVEAKIRRRQIVMAFLFTSVLAALSWGPLVRDFAVLKEQAKPVTIGVQISN